MAQTLAQEAHRAVPVSSSSLADPGAWAVTAFATTSFMLGMYNTGLIGGGSLPVFGTYGPFWVIYGAISTWFAKLASPGSVDSGVALFLAMFAVVTFYFTLASLRTDWTLVAVFTLIFIGLVLLAIGAATGGALWTKAGGWVTLAFAVIAWYHAAADMINFTFGRGIVPVGKITK
jgi:succinate-acetate transporter protein